MSLWQLDGKLTGLSSSPCCPEFDRVESRKSYYVSTFSIQLSTFQFCCTSSECSLCSTHVDGSYGKATSWCWYMMDTLHLRCEALRNYAELFSFMNSWKFVGTSSPRRVFQLNSVWCLPRSPILRNRCEALECVVNGNSSAIQKSSYPN